MGLRDACGTTYELTGIPAWRRWESGPVAVEMQKRASRPRDVSTDRFHKSAAAFDLLVCV
jgi:hypothetical protein